MSTASDDLRIRDDLKLLGPKVLGEVIVKFLEHANLQRTAIQQAIEHSDEEALKNASHSLKGSASTVGVDRVAEICEDLETQARQGSLAGAEERLELLSVELERVYKFLSQHSANAETGSSA